MSAALFLLSSSVTSTSDYSKHEIVCNVCVMAEELGSQDLTVEKLRSNPSIALGEFKKKNKQTWLLLFTIAGV